MFKLVTVTQLGRITRADNHAGNRELIRGVSIDSRTLRPGDAFFALPGTQTDGHEYVRAALNRGAVCAVVQRPLTGEKLMLVKNSLAALGELSRYYRQRLKTTIIGITGTSGKTTVKNVLSQLLAVRYRVRASIGNYNSLIGVPLSLLTFRGDEEFGVLEMGTSQPGEIARLCAIARPQLGLITVVGPGHLQGLGSIEGVRTEKRILFEALPGNGLSVAGDGVGPVERTRHVKFSLGDASDIITDENGSRFCFRGRVFTTRLLGLANVYNCLAALTLALELGVPAEAAAQVLSKIEPEPGRFEPIRRRGVLIINDSYNANPLSMTAALDFVSRLSRHRVFILGDMKELGPETEEHHRKIGDLVRQIGGRLLTMGAESRWYGGRHFSKRQDLLNHLLVDLKGDEVILIKASHALCFDRILYDLLRRL